MVSKVIARRIKSILSTSVFQEQFGFMEGTHIHEAIGVAHEAIHSIKTRKSKGAVL
jgi:hypothetical protein